jgi:hypothetical protein
MFLLIVENIEDLDKIFFNIYVKIKFFNLFFIKKWICLKHVKNKKRSCEYLLKNDKPENKNNFLYKIFIVEIFHFWFILAQLHMYNNIYFKGV